MKSNTLIKSFLWKGLTFLVSFATTVAIAQIFKAELSADFQFQVYTCSIIASFFVFGLDVSITHFVSRRQVSVDWVFSILTLVPLLALVVSIPLTYIFWSGRTPNAIPIKQVVACSSFYIAGMVLVSLSSAALTGIQKNHIASKISFFFSLVLLCLILSVTFFIAPLFWIQFITYLWFTFVFIQGIFFFFYTRTLIRQLYPSSSFEGVSLRRLVTFSFFTFSINFIFLFAGRLPVFFLHRQVSSYLLGNYVYAYKIIEYGAAIAAFIYFPMISLTADKSNRTEKLTLFLVRLSNTAVLISGLIVLISGPYLFQLLLGKSFDLVGELFIYLFPGFLAMCSSNFLTAYFYGKGLLRYNFVSACIMLFSILLSIAPFVSLWDLKGVSIAFSISNLASYVYDLFVFRKLVDFSFKDVFLLRRTDLTRFLGGRVKKKYIEENA